MDDLRNAYKQYGKDYVNSVIKDANNGNKPNIDKTIRDAYAALDLSSKGNEHLKTTLEQLAEIAEIEMMLIILLKRKKLLLLILMLMKLMKLM